MTKYSEVREQMQDGDLLLWRGNSIIAKIIQAMGEYNNHASYIITSEKYDTRRILLYEALAGGVVPTFLSARLERYNGRCWWYSLKAKYEKYRGAIYQAANNYGGTGYDYKSLFENIFGYVSLDAQKLFCSEYVYLSGIDAGLPGISTLKAPRPDDLLMLDWWMDGVEIIL